MFKTKRLFFLLTASLAILQPFSLPIFAQGFAPGEIAEAEMSLAPIRWLPGHPFYFLISFKEVVQKATQPSTEEKTRWDIILSGKRIKETVKLYQSAKTGLATKNLSRYEKKMGDISRGLIKAKREGKDITQLVELLTSHLEKQQALMSQVYFEMDESQQEIYQRAQRIGIDSVVGEKPNYKERLENLTKSSTKQ